MHIIFDLDGVLFDTRQLVKDAYLHVGVDMPDEAWSLPWHQWLIDYVGDGRTAEEVHKRKNEAYADMLESQDLPTLPPFLIMISLWDSGLADVGILTGASRPAVTAMRRRANINAIPLIACGQTQLGKMDNLYGLSTRGIYLDDNPFDVPGWRVVRYSQGETREQVLDNLWMP